MNVDVSHAGEDKAVIPEGVICPTKTSADRDNDPIVDADLARARAINIGQDPLHEHWFHFQSIRDKNAG
jgi:hypothetical protein